MLIYADREAPNEDTETFCTKCGARLKRGLLAKTKAVNWKWMLGFPVSIVDILVRGVLVLFLGGILLIVVLSVFVTSIDTTSGNTDATRIVAAIYMVAMIFLLRSFIGRR